MQACDITRFYTDAQRARWLSAVTRRESCRSLTGPPDVPQLSALHYAAQRVCLSGVRIVIGECGSRLFRAFPFVEPIRGASRFAAIIAARSYLSSLNAGISGEAFILEAASMGIGTCWVSGTFRRAETNVDLEEGERVLAVTPLGQPAREAGQRPRKRKPLASICQSDPAVWPLWAYNAAEAVRAAPSAMNRQPWRMSYAGHTLRLRVRSAPLDLGIAMLHMEIAMGGVRHTLRMGERKGEVLLFAEDAK